MEDEILFAEKQKFTQWWIWLILLVPTALTGYGVVRQVILGQPFGDKPASNLELIAVFGFTLLLTLSFLSLRLETVIKQDGIYVKFFPFHGSFRHYPWEQINQSFVRQYNPILEYGGWGLRGFGKNRAFNVSGNQGLQLELEGNKRILIGTQKPEEITEILKKFGKPI
jgi:hypothetical protein